MTKVLSASLEDYLEVIQKLVKQHGHAHSQEIASELNVKKPSVTAALRNLKEKGLINYKPYMPITLSSEGELIAEKICKRHKTIKDFFVKVLSIPELQADVAACKIEHAIGEDITKRLTDFIAFIDNCPGASFSWKKDIGYSCDAEKKQCKICKNKRLIKSE